MSKHVLLYFLSSTFFIYSLAWSQINFTKYDDQTTTNPPFMYSDPVLYPGTAGEWDEEFVALPSVVYDGSMYHMWYGNAVNEELVNIGYATSPDGITWIKYDDPTTTNPPFAESDPVLNPGPPGSYDDLGVSTPCVLKIGDTYHMWYQGRDNPLSVGYTSICHAKSTNGITWSKDSLKSELKL